MEYLNLTLIRKTFGPRVLLDDVSLTINQGDKIGVIGLNGSGKSTLLKVVAGDDSSENERSEYRVNKKIRISYLPQDPVFQKSNSVIEECYTANHPSCKLLSEYLRIHERDAQSPLLKPLLEKMDDQRVWSKESEIREYLGKLGVEDVNQPVNELSGGERKRLALIKCLVEEPDFLVLDEPTNHLDIDMIEWLESKLGQPGMTLIMVTHDRYFLENVCDVIVELERGKMASYRGNYSYYLQKKEASTLARATSRAKERKLYSRELEWIRRQPKARGTKAKARIDHFEELKESLASSYQEKQVLIDVAPARLGKKILELENISLSYGENCIVNNWNYKFRKNEKVGICGPNGSGKSTIARIIAGTLNSGGKRVVGDTVKFGFYRQDNESLKPDNTVIEEVRDIAEYIPLREGGHISAESFLERFLFSRDQQRVRVSQLSGGEKRRLQLLKVLIGNPNFLILDEPTNDLDIHTLQILESYLGDFEGCLVVITHDRFFLDKIVEHIFVLPGNGIIEDHNGSYSDWRNKRGEWRKSIETAENKAEKSKDEREKKNQKKLSYHEQREMQKLEDELDLLHERRENLMKSFSSGDSHELDMNELSKEMKAVTNQIEACEERWLALADKL
jgi:ATP-binding cassette subfamily F protein uup